MPNHALPSHYGVAQLASGRFYPLYVSGEEPGELELSPSFSCLHWGDQRIPFALGSTPREGVVSFEQHTHAIQYCQRNEEEFALLWQWQQYACQAELYPERNAWYRDEIERLAHAGDCPLLLSRETVDCLCIGTEVHAYIWVHLAGSYQAIRAKAPTLDEALVALYEQVRATFMSPLSDERNERGGSATLATTAAHTENTARGASVNTSNEQGIVQMTLDGLVPGHFALHRSSGILAHLSCEEGMPHLCSVQVFTPSELTILLPLLEQYPNYCPYELLLASFHGSTSESAIVQARKRYYKALEAGRADVLMRPVRNVMSRTRLKLRVFGMDIVSMLETGCMLKRMRGSHAPTAE
nr:hypothetical protein [Ktedonobacteraceae bacterium]